MRQNDMARRMEVSLQFKAGDKVHRLHRLVAVVEQKGASPALRFPALSALGQDGIVEVPLTTSLEAPHPRASAIPYFSRLFAAAFVR